MDTPQDVANGTPNGVKHAAIRKLEHELGIPPQQLPLNGFKFLTRLHYWAADTITHGKDRYGNIEFCLGVRFVGIAQRTEGLFREIWEI